MRVIGAPAVMSRFGSDVAFVVALVAIAAALRFWNLTQLGLTHYDEGSYAMAGKWFATFGRMSHHYSPGFAPGLFPGLVGVFFVLFGIASFAYWAVTSWISNPAFSIFAYYICLSCTLLVTYRDDLTRWARVFAPW